VLFNLNQSLYPGTQDILLRLIKPLKFVYNFLLHVDDPIFLLTICDLRFLFVRLMIDVLKFDVPSFSFCVLITHFSCLFLYVSSRNSSQTSDCPSTLTYPIICSLHITTNNPLCTKPIWLFIIFYINI
jgi:hypothetical protein